MSYGLDRAQHDYDSRLPDEGCWHCKACREEISEDESEQDGLCAGCRGDRCEADKRRSERLWSVIDRLTERSK